MTPEMTLIDDPIKKSDGRKRIDRKYHRIDGEFTKIPLKSNALCDILKNKFEIIVQNVESEVPMDDSKQGVTEELKMQNQMAWVGRMNNILACAEEIVYEKIVYKQP